MGPIIHQDGIPQALNHRVGMPTYYESNHPWDGIISTHNHQVGMPTHNTYITDTMGPIIHQDGIPQAPQPSGWNANIL